ncbi:unnamed protein product [Rotaria socialis]|uniref:Uncharacterized protein n=1 Tax=Rotaria socialis TaxID=392032 RepID=A0A821EUT2_9BILA|nr:unnamed protein product [Rotaria socialis]
MTKIKNDHRILYQYIDLNLDFFKVKLSKCFTLIKVKVLNESATTNCNRIGNNGAKYLADSLRNNTTLTTLDLTGNKIGRNGAQYLAGILRNNKTLLTLDMDSNYIQDHGAEQMASGLKHNKVTNFVLPSHIGLP